MIRFVNDKEYKVDCYTEVEGSEFWFAKLELRGDHWKLELSPGWVMSPLEKHAVNKKLDQLTADNLTETEKKS